MKVKFELSHFPEKSYEEVLEEVEARKLVNPEKMPFSKLPCEEELLKIKREVEKLKEKSDTLVVVGMGGSSRGAKALHEAVGKKDEKLKFLDNVDPNLISKTFNELNWERSSFAFISKSGRTLETVTVMNLVLDQLKKRGLSPQGRTVFIGDPGNSFQQLARELGSAFIPIPKEVGGRFSVFTAVGLVPAMFAGYSVEKLLEGAFDLLETPLPALYLAAAKYLHYQAGRKISVVMPYSSYMAEFTEWYVQLWAESLGKEGKGQTPLKAVGTASQHAILQLFMDGPDDKFFQLFFVKHYAEDPKLPQECYILPFLAGKKVSEVMEAEFKGTVHALKSRNRPMVIFEMEELSEYQMGYLFMGYMVAVVVMGKLLGVNPYGQPAVEIGKKVAIEELRRESNDEGGMQ
ncbi:phosphoglucose isomerase (PGI) [Thermovibrio ammonificans HB-1]|uniref:Glucose-6-phosphate isomerase n=1 Tax=Thermovibrio ammonificans (strain DSM 15698 / JCM 12110 / HB-1) TaxID=648996 RepID=E8T246_THEA1|nr:hypothetical protein [Thermovibrio ammonificans]ADU96941.1 phosphoglucose isomerase (PGI) [Thermovibrio ammonificans HB-1]